MTQLFHLISDNGDWTPEMLKIPGLCEVVKFCGRIVMTIVRDQSDWNSVDSKDLFQMLD